MSQHSEPSNPTEQPTIPSSSTLSKEQSTYANELHVAPKAIEILANLNKEKDTAVWQAKEMDINSFLLDPAKIHSTMPENSQRVYKEEDSKAFDIGDLDIISLEQACRKQEFDKILEGKIKTFEVVVSRVHQKRTLGI